MTSPQTSRHPPTWLIAAWVIVPCVPQKPGVRQVAGWHDGSFDASNVCVQPVCGLQASSVQTLLSLQLAELSVWVQPVTGLQPSVVQALLSLQLPLVS